ncbi:MAG: hypothetical protein M3077_07165 [Candidatus Dormibacteraeota bacterium]|nr:hypothetical protein [Candidatus Dormibacteraeota bacterium]
MPQSERADDILNAFRELAGKMIKEWDDYGLVREDNGFRGPAPSSFMMSARDEGQGVVVLRIQRRDLPWRREIRIAQNDSWKESTNGGPVERSSADFWSEQKAIITRLFDDVRQPQMKEELSSGQ